MLAALASLAALPSRQADDAELDRRMYHVALEGVTRYALNEAVKAILRGALGHTFFPSPVELRQQCDAAQRPVNEQLRRERVSSDQARESAAWRRLRAQRTPAEIERVKAAYARACELHAAACGQLQPDPRPILDPKLLAQIPDAPSTFVQPKISVE